MPDPICRVKVAGLKKAGHKGATDETINLTCYGFLHDIAEQLQSHGHLSNRTFLCWFNPKQDTESHEAPPPDGMSATHLAVPFSDPQLQRCRMPPRSTAAPGQALGSKRETHYEFEVDSSGKSMENEVTSNLDALHGAANRLNCLKSSDSAPMAASTESKVKQARTPVESWAMGIAAGGRLAQQIHSDITPPTLRTKRPFATTLVSVQLLNAMAYDALTGMLCPPAPITLKQYVDSGIPWFDTYKSHVQSTHGGQALREIKSVGELDSQENIEASTSVAASQRVACTVCRRNFCDCVLRPCNHTFCAERVKARMVYYPNQNVSIIHCETCREIATQVLGFSAPMALPGQEDWLPDIGADVVAKSGHFGKPVAFKLE